MKQIAISVGISVFLAVLGSFLIQPLANRFWQTPFDPKELERGALAGRLQAYECVALPQVPKGTDRKTRNNGSTLLEQLSARLGRC